MPVESLFEWCATLAVGCAWALQVCACELVVTLPGLAVFQLVTLVAALGFSLPSFPDGLPCRPVRRRQWPVLSALFRPMHCWVRMPTSQRREHCKHLSSRLLLRRQQQRALSCRQIQVRSRGLHVRAVESPPPPRPYDPPTSGCNRVATCRQIAARTVQPLLWACGPLRSLDFLAPIHCPRPHQSTIPPHPMRTL